ncbi:MAG: glycosyl transferase [Lachnospiraceae bacterium]|nr:glycosyl transferase [Lachnospiraceae bacterium]
MKVLILSTGTGEGHNSAGKAVLEQFRKRGIPCEMADVLGFASERAASYGKRIYVWSTVKATKVFKGAYKAGRAITSSRRKSPVYYANALYAEKLYHYIVDNGYDTIVMPHLFPAEALTYMLRKHGCRPDIRTYFVGTDYTCIPFTEETEADYYFIAHEELTEEYVKKGIAPEKLVPTGIPVSDRFRSLPSREEARESLGMNPEGHCILVMTGSMGYGKIENLVRALVSRMDGGDNVYILGGSNEKLKARLREAYREDPRVRVLDYTDRTAEYLAAADLLFTKPGGLTSTEAAVAGIPLAHTRPIPGCEDCNQAFYNAHGMSLSADSEEKLVEAAMELLSQPKACRQMIERQHQVINGNAARDICDFILRQGGEEEEAGLRRR